MKLERFGTVLTAAALAFLLAFGALGCLISGFELEITDKEAMTAALAGASLLISVLFALKWGAGMLACGIAFGAGWLWHRGGTGAEILSLISRVSEVYHKAYQWGYLAAAEAPVDLPLLLAGLVIVLFAARALVRGKNMVLPLLLAALPLSACMVVTDTVPQEPYLFALLAAGTVCMVTQGVRRENPAQGCRLTAMVAAPVLLALGLLFAAVPQESYVNRSKDIQEKLLSLAEEIPQMAQTAAEQISAGVQEEQQDLDLKRMGPRPEYTHAVMEVSADFEGLLYLRGQDYDAYTGTGWTASPHRAESFRLDGEPGHTITVRTRSRRDLLYLPYYAAAELVGGGAKNTGGLREYTLEYTALPENWREQEEALSEQIELTPLEVEQLGSTADRLRYLTLPGETSLKAEELVSAIVPAGATREEAADAIAEFVRNSAEYDLNTPRMPTEEGDFALWFLQNSDTGYCVHYATAAVVLLRAADIPARYVTGYLTRVEPGETVTVTAGNAHAWAEYYLPRLGIWVPLEATPAEAVTTTSSPAEETGATETRPVSTAGAAPENTEPTTQKETSAQPEPEETAPEGKESIWGLLTAAAAMGLLWAQRKLRLWLLDRRMASGGANRRALVRWREAARLAKLRRQTPPEELHRLAQRAKFSQHNLTEAELARFDAYIRSAHAAMKQQPWYRQLAYRWWYVVY